MNTKDVLNSEAAKYAVLALAALAVLWYVKNKAKQAVDATGKYLQEDGFNIRSDKNIPTVITKSVVDAVAGKGSFEGFWDHTFAAVDLINPFNESDTYAKQVWGIGEKADAKNISNNNSEGIWE